MSPAPAPAPAPQPVGDLDAKLVLGRDGKVRKTVEDIRALMADMKKLGIEVSIWPVPVEIEEAVPFAEDTEHASYDPAADRQ